MDKEMLDLFIYYVVERNNVYQRREAGMPKPWTDDPILQRHHFCNNRREDDRGTKEIRALMKTIADIERLPCLYTMARMFNHWETVDRWLEGGVPLVKRYRNLGCKTFNTAYVVSTCGESMDKVDYVARVVHQVAEIYVPRTSCRDAFEALREVSGLGSFLAGQVVADLKNDRYLKGAPDWYTFSVMGPGSKKGLDFIFGPGTTERNFESRISSLEVLCSGKIQPLHRQDLQNTLCEFSKFVRYQQGLPGRRRKYNAHN